MDELINMTGGYTTGKMDVMKFISIDIHERNLLATYGYYPRVKYVLDRYDKEGKYLIGSDIYPNMIILYYWPFDHFNIHDNNDVVHLYDKMVVLNNRQYDNHILLSQNKR